MRAQHPPRTGGLEQLPTTCARAPGRGIASGRDHPRDALRRRFGVADQRSLSSAAERCLICEAIWSRFSTPSPCRPERRCATSRQVMPSPRRSNISSTASGGNRHFPRLAQEAPQYFRRPKRVQFGFHPPGEIRRQYRPWQISQIRGSRASVMLSIVHASGRTPPYPSSSPQRVGGCRCCRSLYQRTDFSGSARPFPSAGVSADIPLAGKPVGLWGFRLRCISPQPRRRTGGPSGGAGHTGNHLGLHNGIARDR